MSNSSIYGPNAWLIDEQFQQYSKDPNSVDKEWKEFFEKNGAPKQQGESAAAAPKAAAPKAAAPKSDAKATEGKPTSTKQAARKTEVDSSVEQAKKAQKAPAPVAPAPKKGPQSPLDRIEPYPEFSEKPLKGMFKAIAKNMDQSLEIPTATTVRDMPVKLMWEKPFHDQ